MFGIRTPTPRYNNVCPYQLSYAHRDWIITYICWVKWQLNDKERKRMPQRGRCERRKEVGLYGCLSILNGTLAGMLTINKTWFPFVNLENVLPSHI